MKPATRMEPLKYVEQTCGNCGQTRQTLTGAWLRWKREQAGISLREVARRSGLSPTFLSQVETGQHVCTPRTELAYAEALKSGQQPATPA